MFFCYNKIMINWFPGHMNKTLKQMQQDSKICDCFIYILDSRCPKSCINPEFVKVIGNKPIIFVLNKSDLVQNSDLDKFKKYFNQQGYNCISLNATISGSSKIIINTIKSVFKDRLEKNKEKNVNFIIRAMILGIPNSGKSTIVNNLCGKARATTGNRAGVTRNKQWVKLDNYIEVMDTPGVLLPNFENEEYAYNLAITGAVKDEILNLYDIASVLIDKLKKLNLIDVLNSKYGVDINNSTLNIEIIKAIGKKRGCILKGGDIDFDRTAKLLLTDFRAGKLGKICLEIL